MRTRWFDLTSAIVHTVNAKELRYIECMMAAIYSKYVCLAVFDIWREDALINYNLVFCKADGILQCWNWATDVSGRDIETTPRRNIRSGIATDLSWISNAGMCWDLYRYKQNITKYHTRRHVTIFYRNLQLLLKQRISLGYEDFIFFIWFCMPV